MCTYGTLTQMLWATLKMTTVTDKSINIDDINEVTDKVYVQLIDGSIAWAQTNAHKLSDNEYLILPV